MEVSDQLLVPVASPLGKELQYPLARRMRGTELVWMFIRRENKKKVFLWPGIRPWLVEHIT
jgi:hypothetical protein